MADTILPGIDGDLIDGPVGDDTLFGGDIRTGIAAPDTETVILDGRLWRIVRRVGGATVVDGVTRRLIEVEEV